MPGLDLLDVVIGVVFMYLVVSLICSAAAEFFEALARFRASDLEHGIAELLQQAKDDPNSLVKKVYDHPLVNSLYVGKYGDSGAKLPSYIPSRNFALALLEVIGGSGAINAATPPPSTAPRPAIQLADTFKDTSAYKAVAALVSAAQNDAAKARENIEEWFNSGMDRVSGWYKRRTQFILFGLGVVAAAAFNLDTISVAKALAANKGLRDNIVKQAMTTADQPAPAAAVTRGAPPDDAVKTAKDKEVALKNQIAVLHASGLPVGWSNQFLPQPEGCEWILKILGLLVTACAVSLGAPFWFDMLNKIIVVRSTVKPKEKSGTEGSKEPK